MNILDVQNGKQAKGQRELISHLEGERLTVRQALFAKCYDCMGFFIDGKVDCKSHDCPLYPFFVYKVGGSVKTRTMSDEQKEKVAERLKKGREKKQADESLRGVRRKLT